jgi:hypothetical protein
MEPEFIWTYNWLARAYRWAGNHPAEVEARARASEVSGNPEEANLIRESFARGGWNGYLREMLRNGQGGFPVTSQLGEATELDREKAIQGFMTQADKGNFWLFLLKIEPGFEPLRADPRIQEIIKKFEPPQ